MRIARAPFGFVSGGVGAIRWRSGCTRAAASRQPWHRPQGGTPASRLGSGHPPTAPASRPPVQSNAWANASAVVIRPAPVGPTNAYACATRSVASARRSRATARGWSRIASSATQEVLDERAYLRGDHGRGLGRAHKPHALGLRAQDLQVAPAHAPVESERLALEVVAPPGANPPEPLGGIHVEEQREVGQDAAGRPDVQLTDQVGVDPAPVALVRHGRVGVAVGEHDAAAREPRADLLGDVLVARGHEQEDLDERLGPAAGALEQAAHGEPEARPVGLAGARDPVPLGARNQRLARRGQRWPGAQKDSHSPRMGLDPVGNLARQLDHQPGDVRAKLPTADRFDRIDVDRQGSHRPVIQGVLEIEDETVRPVHQLAPVPWRARRLDVDPDAVTPGLDGHVDQLDGRVGGLSRGGSGPEGEHQPEDRQPAAAHARPSSIRKSSHVTRRDRHGSQMWLMVSRSRVSRSRRRPRSRIWRARWRPPRPNATARASTSPPKRMPKATTTMSRPIPISVSAVANANSRTSHRAARARTRASGRPALTAAISTPCPRKFAASQPTTRISSAESVRGRRCISVRVAPGAPGIARASIPMVAKTTKTLQITLSRRRSDGALETPARASAPVRPHVRLRRSRSTARARRPTSAPPTQPSAAPKATSVSIARTLGMTTRSVPTVSRTAVQTRSRQKSAILRPPCVDATRARASPPAARSRREGRRPRGAVLLAGHRLGRAEPRLERAQA